MAGPTDTDSVDREHFHIEGVRVYPATQGTLKTPVEYFHACIFTTGP